jgi:alpha-amylase/alpha-mannosidase (GH57 family)
MPGAGKIRVAILWHMHQPFYLNPEDNKLMMPWVRLHGLKDYLDMPLMAAKYNVKVTFNLVPSLLDQIEMYNQGYTDRHLELSKIPARDLSYEEKSDILDTFFSAHYPSMIAPYARYRQLYRKKESCGTDLDLAVKIFSTSEWRDLQVWGNMVWIDPMFRSESEIRELYRKARDFTEAEKEQLLQFELNLLKRIMPTYQKLFREGAIDISFSPYYHPILPLLIDTDSAKEAIDDITLPQNGFRHPEDARWHIQQAVEKFRQLFGRAPVGMWPSEGSVSEETLRLVAENGIKWLATDEEILRHSLMKSYNEARKFSPHFVYEFEGVPGAKIFFRDHGLSDKIGFVYSGWDADRAVNDFILSLRNIARYVGNSLGNCIVPIILDGENAWEYFPRDGIEFLGKFYEALSHDEAISVVSLSDAAEILEAEKLPALFAGSWINHNFRIWIGHPEDNQAWDLLSLARKSVSDYQNMETGVDPEKLRRAWNQIYIAEGSDWCWWFGDEHQGMNNDQFDRLYRNHLMAVYKILGLEPPPAFLMPIHKDRMTSCITMPESLITPVLDGLLTHYYEWSGAGHYDCCRAGGAMHRTGELVTGIYFAFDYDYFYVRIDFVKEFDLTERIDYKVLVDFQNIGRKEIVLETGAKKDFGEYAYSYDRILEIRFDRKKLVNTGSGRIEFSVLLVAGGDIIEKWPPDKSVSVELPDKGKIMFWQV